LGALGKVVTVDPDAELEGLDKPKLTKTVSAMKRSSESETLDID